MSWVKASAPASNSGGDDVLEAAGLLHSGQLAEAGRVCEAILQRDPGNAAALELVFELAYRTQRFEDAAELLQAGTAAHPEDPLLQYRLGCLLEQAGALAEAETAYRAALQLDVAFAKAVNNLGSVLQQQGDIERPLALFERALQLDPALWQAHYNIGNFHKLQGGLRAAMRPYQEATRLRRAVGTPTANEPELFGGASQSKLVHDAQQLDYLLARGALGHEYRPVADALKRAAVELEAEFQQSPAADFPAELQGAAAPYYNRLVHVCDAPALPGPAVNPDLDWQAIAADYARNAPGITHADQFLVPEALASLRRFCLESTLWFDFLYLGGYVGATLEQGFVCPLLVQIAEELPRAMPGIFGDHPLTHLWAYKYDSRRSGIKEHADFAAVNVNFWITPDEANLAPGSGGLVVWDKEAPADWDFATYNDDVDRIRNFLAESGARPVNVPYRQNRCVIFNSDLFHKTDSYHFRPEYENRRINITLLYGYRQASEDPRNLLR